MELVEDEVDELLLLLEEELVDDEVASIVTRPEMRVMATVVLSPEAVANTEVPWLAVPHPYW